MNRQQRRSRKKLSRAEWSLMLAKMQKGMPGLPGHVAAAQLLVGIIVDEQLNISDASLATLAGLACGHMALAWADLPQAACVSKEGKPVYSVDQIAEFVGLSPEETRASLEGYLEEIGATALGQDDVTPLH